MKISHVLKLCREFENRLMETHIVIYTSQPRTQKTNVKTSSLEELIFKANETFWISPITQ